MCCKSVLIIIIIIVIYKYMMLYMLNITSKMFSNMQKLILLAISESKFQRGLVCLQVIGKTEPFFSFFFYESLYAIIQDTQ